MREFKNLFQESFQFNIQRTFHFQLLHKISSHAILLICWYHAHCFIEQHFMIFVLIVVVLSDFFKPYRECRRRLRCWGRIMSSSRCHCTSQTNPPIWADRAHVAHESWPRALCMVLQIQIKQKWLNPQSQKMFMSLKYKIVLWINECTIFCLDVRPEIVCAKFQLILAYICQHDTTVSSGKLCRSLQNLNKFERNLY